MKNTSKKRRTSQGEELIVFKMQAESGACLTLSNYGASIIGWEILNEKGELDDIVVSLAQPEDYLKYRTYLGATIGRVAGRISLGEWQNQSVKVQLQQNEGVNHCHGGSVGFDNQFWDGEFVQTEEEQFVRFTLVSPNGAAGYPGMVEMVVEYHFTEDNQVKIDLKAKADQKTLINPTNHVYFNLAGKEETSVGQHELQLNSDRFAPINAENIPTGELVEVQGSIFDFNDGQSIASVLANQHPQILQSQGLNHAFLMKPKLDYAGCLSHQATKRKLYFKSTAPSAVIYSGNHFAGELLLKNNQRIQQHGGIAIEMQALPDAIHHPKFGDIELKPGEEFHREIWFQLICL